MVYKYRNWNDKNHKRCLTCNQLYFSGPCDMNDPFDFKIPPDFSLLNTDEKILEYIDLGISNLSPEGLMKIKDIDEFRDSFFNSWKLNPEKIQLEYELRDSVRANKHFGVLCFSKKWDNILMWTHYADNSKGFCLGFDNIKLEEARIGMSGGVRYQDDFPTLDPLDTDHLTRIAIQMHTKAKDWAYEDEYRISKINFPELTIGDRIYEYPDSFLEEIIIGLNIPETHKLEIIEIAKSKHIPVFQIIKKPKSFLYDRIKLDY